MEEMALSEKGRRSLLTSLIGANEDYVSNIVPLFAIVMFIFIFSTYLGYVMGEGIPPSVFEDILGNIPQPTGSNDLEILVAIVSNNIIAAFIFLASGVMIGVPPLIFVELNGFFVGWISYTASVEVGLGTVAMSLLPHGVIEIPTVVLCAAMGMGLGYQLINRIRGRVGLQRYVIDSLRVFTTRVIPFLVVAGLIETVIITLLT
jgi:stage II sporulation protein M